MSIRTEYEKSDEERTQSLTTEDSLIQQLINIKNDANNISEINLAV